MEERELGNKKIEVTPELENLLENVIKLRSEFINQDDSVKGKQIQEQLGHAHRKLTDYLEDAISQA